jgi:hypothetical protein
MLQQRVYDSPMISDVESLRITVSSFEHTIDVASWNDTPTTDRGRSISFARALTQRRTWVAFGARPVDWKPARLWLMVLDAKELVGRATAAKVPTWKLRGVGIQTPGCRWATGKQQASLEGLFRTRTSAYWKSGEVYRAVLVRVVLPGESPPDCPMV